jgi:hypothetical protein
MRTPAEHSRPADWLHERLLEPWSGSDGGNPVGSIVPTGFAAYARVFHAPEPGVTWADVAAATGRVAHPLMEWHRITAPAPGSGRVSWDRSAPMEGEPSDEELRELIAVLRDHTATAELCWFCAWVGFGGTKERGAAIRLPDREYFLSSGPIEDALSFEQPPNIWWPDDRAWCVASEIDLLATYVGGTAACIDALLASVRLEAMRVSIDDRVDARGDGVNRD